MEISFGLFLILLINVFIFLGASSSLANIEKKRAIMFSVLALILSLMPWIKTNINNHKEQAAIHSF